MLLIPYARRSSESQRRNTSEFNQQREIERYCVSRGYQLACPLIAEIKTGTTIARDGFWQALRLLVCLSCPPGRVPSDPEQTYIELQKPCKCASPKGADGVIAYDIDRLGRDARILLWLAFNFLQARGKALVILHGFDKVDTTTPEGRLHFMVMAAVAQYRRDRWIADGWKAREIKAQSNKYAGGRPPFGWGARHEELVPDEKEQVTLAKMEQLYAYGLPCTVIAAELNRLGYYRRSGKIWTAPAVWSILNQWTHLRDWMRSGCSYNHMEMQDGETEQEADEQLVPEINGAA